MKKLRRFAVVALGTLALIVGVSAPAWASQSFGGGGGCTLLVETQHATNYVQVEILSKSGNCSGNTIRAQAYEAYQGTGSGGWLYGGKVSSLDYWSRVNTSSSYWQFIKGGPDVCYTGWSPNCRYHQVFG